MTRSIPSGSFNRLDIYNTFPLELRRLLKANYFRQVQAPDVCQTASKIAYSIFWDFFPQITVLYLNCELVKRHPLQPIYPHLSLYLPDYNGSSYGYEPQLNLVYNGDPETIEKFYRDIILGHRNDNARSFRYTLFNPLGR